MKGSLWLFDIWNWLDIAMENGGKRHMNRLSMRIYLEMMIFDGYVK